jgi:hypothetical protein
VKSNQIDILPWAVLRDFKQIDDTQKSRLPRLHRSDIRKTDPLDRIHHDLTFFHAVPVAHFDMRTLPYADAASDLSSTTIGSG